jgi:hypothetical protein
MEEDKWISVADATDFFETPDACALINQAWKSGTGRFRGVRPGESEPVEIPFHEDGKIDCAASRVVDGLFTTYLSVTMRWADAKRLAPAAVELLAEEATTPASPPSEPTPQSAASVPAAEEPPAGADVKRSAEDAETPSPPPEKAPQGALDADILDILEAECGPLVTEVAVALRRHFPEGRPRGWKRDKLMHYVHEKSEGKIDIFSPATLDRAFELAWPRAKRSRASKAAKPPR